MDRNSIIGLVLIAGIVIVFSIMNMPSQEQIDAERRLQDSLARVDSIANTKKTIARETGDNEVSDSSNAFNEYAQKLVAADSTQKKQLVLTPSDSARVDSMMRAEAAARNNEQYGIFSNAAAGKKEYFVIENELLRVTISNRGGGIVSAELKKYHSYRDYVAKKDIALRLFDEDSSRMSLGFFVNSKRYTTDEFYFTGKAEGASSASLRLTSNDGKKYIEVKYSIRPGKYNVDYQVKTEGFANNEVNESLEMIWNMRPLLTEKHIPSERQVSSVFYKYVDEKRTYLSEYGDDEKNLESTTEWIAFKTAYFSSVVIAPKGIRKDASRVEVRGITSNKYNKQYNAFINMAAPRDVKDIKPLVFYFGPNDYDVLSDQGYGMENIINLGWGIFGWVNKWLVIPVFNMLEALNLNYGIIILLLTLIVKILILPLTYRNYKSSAKMRVLKPEISEINKKHADEPMKKQQATMALYRQSGVSPMAGCIPVLIQMPVLIAVFRFFPSAIQLRQESFLWAEDLSAYDSIANLPFSLPLGYGDHVSLFTIFMCVSTILFTYANRGQMDQNQAMPGMKFMMYFFPVLMLFFFNNMAAGLSYYYFVSNLLSILIMWMVKKYFIDEKKIRLQIEEYKKRPDAAKKSKFQQRLEEAQRQRAQQLKNKKK